MQEGVITVIKHHEDNGQHGTFGSVIGGGGVPQFVSKDLQPYMIKQIDIGNNIFVFEDYIKAIDSANIDCSDKLQFTCNMPFEQLLPKLTVPELWKIVECHKLSLPARVLRTDIQKALFKHTCQKCAKYVTVFTQVKDEAKEIKLKKLDKVKRYQAKQEGYKSSNSAASKKYQSSHSEYRTSNLAAVIKHQDAQGEDYLASHLVAVKKNQARQGEDYLASNLVAVKKNQARQGEDYLASHLVAVKKNQARQGEDYLASNQVAVKKYQETQGEDYLTSNQLAVRKYQETQGEDYLTSNQLAVRKYQETQGEDYLASNKVAVEKYQDKQGPKYTEAHLIAVKKSAALKNKPKFPPAALTCDMQLDILTDACKDMDPIHIVESGCAVCGKLTPNNELSDLADMSLNLDVLKRRHVTRRERVGVFDKMTHLPGPVLAEGLDKICSKCTKPLAKGKYH
jgi:hypothetical protein